MNTTMVASGLHLDHAWTQLGSTWGRALRAWSLEAVATLVGEATSRKATHLVLLGGLLDRANVLPDTVEFVAAVLGTFDGQVVVVPGPRDWAGDDGPYESGTWAPNTHIVTGAAYAPVPGAPELWASAWTGPTSHPPRVPHGDGAARTYLRPGPPDGAAPTVPDGSRLLTTGTGEGGLSGVPPLVDDPAADHGWVLLIDPAQPGATPARVDIAGQPGSLVTLDVTDLATPDMFEQELKNSCTVEGPLKLHLTGHLAPKVLLPGYGGPEVAADIALDTGGLSFATHRPDPSDRSTQAEFVRSMAMTRGDDLERHQTTALGLRALGASTGD